MDRLAFKTDRVEINQGDFRLVLLHQMVERTTGKLSDPDYFAAVTRAARENNIVCRRDSLPDLQNKNIVYLSTISQQIADAAAENREEKAGAT